MRLVLVWRRPAVSTSTRSASRLAAELIASKTTEPGSAPSCPRTIPAPVTSAQCVSCSAAAARNVSAAASTTRATVVGLLAARPWRWSWSCPTPLTPTNIHTLGSPAVCVERAACRRRRAARPARCAAAPSARRSRRSARSVARSRTSPRIRSVDGHADVGEQQRVLEVVPGLVVDAVTAAQARRTRRGSCRAAP